MAFNPLRSRRTIQRNEHGPVARRRLDSNLQRTFAEAFSAEAIRQEFADGLTQLRAEILEALAEERGIRRGRVGGLTNLVRGNLEDIGRLAERIIRLEHPEFDGGGPEGGENLADPSRLRPVLAPVIPLPRRREDAA
ncbi:MAG: hypothetical protein HOY79_49690 [Streptomyces sp.]|nr:hypothetical protein [Streptomyces sp.]